jgi:hypothetical protein
MKRKVEVEFEDFGWEALTEEAERQGVSVEELVYHAAMLYLAANRTPFSHRVPGERRQPRQTRRWPAD